MVNIDFALHIDEYGVYQGPEVWEHPGPSTVPVLDKKKLKSLGKLKKVVGGLYLGYCVNLEDLGALEEVGGALSVEGCGVLLSLGNLRKVGGELDLRGANIRSLAKLEQVGGDLYTPSNVTKNGGSILIDWGNLQRVGEDLVLYQPLPELQEGVLFCAIRIQTFLGVSQGARITYRAYRAEVARIKAMPLTELVIKLVSLSPIYKRVALNKIKGVL